MKNLPVSVVLCWFQLPLLPTATLLSVQTGSCQRGHVAWPLCSFRETCSAKLTLQKCQALDPGLEREESCCLVWKPGVSSQHAGLAILTLGLCSS